MFTMEYKTIGAKILYYRRIKGLTQEKLSKMSDVSRARISDIENGKGPCNIETLLMLAKALEVDVTALMSKE